MKTTSLKKSERVTGKLRWKKFFFGLVLIPQVKVYIVFNDEYGMRIKSISTWRKLKPGDAKTTPLIET